LRHRFVTVALLVVAMFALGVVASACDGDGGDDELTLEEFFQELQALDDELEAQFAELEEPFEALGEDSSVDEAADILQQQADLIQDFVDRLDDLNPPDEAADLLDEAVSAGRAAADAFQNAIDDARDAESLDELFGVFETGDIDAAFERFDEGCLDAEQLAADNDITVDLNCGDEG